MQEGRTPQRCCENRTLREALDAAVEGENKLGARLRSYFHTDLFLERSPSPGSFEERLSPAANVSQGSDDVPTDGAAAKDVFHIDQVTHHAGEEPAYACSSDGWYSKKNESQDGHVSL